MEAENRFDPEPILKALNEHDVAYVVVGGFAAAAHVVVRATRDLDLVVARTWTNAKRLASALDASDATGADTPLTPEVLVRKADRRFVTPHGEVRLLHETPGVPDFRELEPGYAISIAGETVTVATLADLRRMKLASDRLKDRADLAELDELHGNEGR